MYTFIFIFTSFMCIIFALSRCTYEVTRDRGVSQPSIFFCENAQNTELVCLRLGDMQGTFDPLCSWYKG